MEASGSQLVEGWLVSQAINVVLVLGNPIFNNCAVIIGIWILVEHLIFKRVESIGIHFESFQPDNDIGIVFIFALVRVCSTVDGFNFTHHSVWVLLVTHRVCIVSPVWTPQSNNNIVA